MLVNVGLRRTHFQPEPGELGIPFPLGKSYIGKSRSPLVPGSGQWILANTHSIRRTQREQGGSAFRGKRICDTATTTTTTDTTVVEKNGAIQIYRLCPGPLDPLGPLGPLGQAFSKFLLLLGSFLLPRLGGDRWRSKPSAIGDKQKVGHS